MSMEMGKGRIGRNLAWRAAAAAGVALAALASGGCNTLEQAINTFTNPVEDDMLIKCSMRNDEDACRYLDKYNDVKKQCTVWESGLACAELGKIYAYGEKEVGPDKVRAQKYFDKGCELKSKESCDLALKFKNGTMPETADKVLPGVEVSTYETRQRAFVASTIASYAVMTCPGPVSDVFVKQSEAIKAYGRKEYPSIKEEFPEYWGGYGMLPGRDKAWYMNASRRMSMRPGTEDSGIIGWLMK